MADVQLKISSRGTEVIRGQLRGVEKAADALGTTGQRAGRRLGSAFATVGKELFSIGTAMKAVVAGAAVKGLVDITLKWGVLQGKLRMTNAEIMALKDQMELAAAAAGKGDDAAFAMLETFSKMGIGATKELIPIIGSLLKFSAATGESEESIAAVAAKLKQNFKLSNDEILTGLSTMQKQSELSGLSLGELADTLGGLASKGFTGVTGLESILPIISLFKSVGLGAEEARMSIRGMLTELPKKSKEFTKFGINIFADPKKTKVKNIKTIIDEAMIKTGGNLTKLSKLFGKGGMRVVEAFIAGMQSGDVDKIFTAKGSLDEFTAALNRFEGGIAGTGIRVKKEFSKVSNAIEEFGLKALKFTVENPILAALMGFGAFAGKKLIGAGIGKLLSGGGAGVGATMAAGAGPLGVQKVWVVNLPGGGIGGTPGGGGYGNMSTTGKKAKAVPSAPPVPIGVGGAAMSAAVKLGIAGIAAYTVGKGLAYWFETGLPTGLQAEAGKRIGVHKTSIATQSALERASKLVEMRKAGLTTAEVAPGKRKEITAENFFPKIVEFAKTQGVAGEDLKALIGKLDTMAVELKNASTITIVNKSGVKDLEARRGKQQ